MLAGLNLATTNKMAGETLKDRGHHFDSRGGRCYLCDKTWQKHWDRDSKVFGQPCHGRKEDNPDDDVDGFRVPPENFE
jgi:hypothetical protein